MSYSVKIVLLNANNLSNCYSELSFLKEEDFIYINRFKTELGRKEHAASMYLKRKYIGDYIIDQHGKPICDKTYFNVSHSHGLVGIAICDIPIGIDIELIRRSEDDIHAFISSEDEYNYIHDDKSFYEVWTNKESLMKCIGTGIHGDIKNIPALPINGLKERNKMFFYTKNIVYNNYIISVTTKSKDGFDIIFSEEKL